MIDTTAHDCEPAMLTSAQELRALELRALLLEAFAIAVVLGVGLFVCWQYATGNPIGHAVNNLGGALLLILPVLHVALVTKYALVVVRDPSGLERRTLPRRYLKLLEWRGLIFPSLLAGAVAWSNNPDVMQLYLWPVLPACLLIYLATK